MMRGNKLGFSVVSLCDLIGKDTDTKISFIYLLLVQWIVHCITGGKASQVGSQQGSMVQVWT